jgi:hypothetical protein
MRSALIAVLGLALSVPIATAEERRVPRIATARLALGRAEPAGLEWKHSQQLDVNCDGTLDEVFTATDQFRFYVGVVLGPVTRKSQYSVVSFALTGDFQDSFCGSFESLSPEPLTTEIADAIGEEPFGYRASKSCKGLKLAAGECDAFHLFWNHVSNALNWWRL